MKKFWKALGLTALAAAVIPYRVHKDEEENTTSVDALMWQLTRRTGQGEEKAQVDVTIGFKSPLQEIREERQLFTEDPEEALFDDSGLEPAPAVKAEEPAEEKAPTAEEPAEPDVTEEDFDPEL